MFCRHHNGMLSLRLRLGSSSCRSSRHCCTRVSHLFDSLHNLDCIRIVVHLRRVGQIATDRNRIALHRRVLLHSHVDRLIGDKLLKIRWSTAGGGHYLIPIRITRVAASSCTALPEDIVPFNRLDVLKGALILGTSLG